MPHSLSSTMTDTQDLAALKRLTELDDDLDSDALDHLEDEAEKELMEEMEYENLACQSPSLSSRSDESASSDYVFGPLAPEDVAEILHDLRKLGMVECLRRHIMPNPSRIMDILLSLGVMLPRSMLQEAEEEPFMLLSLIHI